MAKFAVIHMATDGLLFVCNSPIGNTWIIGVDSETVAFNCLPEFPVIQQAGNHYTINGFQTLTDQDTFSLTVHGDKAFVGAWINLHK